MSMIEGIGDEVLILTVVVCVLATLLLAWMSTAVQPLWAVDSMWLVQMRNSPNRAVIEMTQIDSRQANELATQGQAQMVRITEMQANSQNINNELVPESDADAQRLNDAIRSAGLSEPPTSNENTLETDIGSDNAPNSATPVVSAEACDIKESNNVSMATIKLKYINDTSKMVRTWLSDTVAEFKRSHFNDDVSAGRAIRLIYGGQLLRDDTRSLASYGITDDSTVHCHVSNRPYRHENSAASSTQAESNSGSVQFSATLAHEPFAPNQFEIGHYMHLIFVCKFALLWFFFITYPQYFDLSSFFSLGICTCVYCAFIGLGRYRRQNNRNPVSPAPSNGTRRDTMPESSENSQPALT